MTPLSSPTKPTPEEEIKLVSASETELLDSPQLAHAAPFPLSPVPETASPQLEDYDPTIGAKPYSPFYRHATPSFKLECLALQPKRSRTSGTSPIDEVGTIGAGGGRGRRNTTHASAWQRLSDEESGNRRESKLWMQEKRHCDCLQGMTRNQRVFVKAAIAVVILGSMVAIALGITAAVGGGVWKSDHQQEEFRG